MQSKISRLLLGKLLRLRLRLLLLLLRLLRMAHAVVMLVVHSVAGASHVRHGVEGRHGIVRCHYLQRRRTLRAGEGCLETVVLVVVVVVVVVVVL